jgi:BirA family transcriptional regulator, biotin operon repressor / biotin---[acetyl-CoA-carboxylase] ligase
VSPQGDPEPAPRRAPDALGITPHGDPGPAPRLGRPRLHLRETGSTNDRARALAAAGAPHGTLVTARAQTAGRGRHGRTWIGPPGRALLLSLVVRELEPLLPLRAGLAVADVAGPDSLVKWPNDVWLAERKVAGVLVEARPQSGWAVVGIGLNVAVELAELPEELRTTAGTLGRDPSELEAALRELLSALEHRLAEPATATVQALRARDALRGRRISWDGGEGVGAGIDDAGCLLVTLADGSALALDSGEVLLVRGVEDPW